MSEADRIFEELEFKKTNFEPVYVFEDDDYYMRIKFLEDAKQIVFLGKEKKTTNYSDIDQHIHNIGISFKLLEALHMKAREMWGESWI